ncbi:MAG: DUF1643 domain-containing protein [Bdellovibrionales bacterium]
MKLETKALKSSANYSKCKKYRYLLKREFPSGEGRIVFIMLNPSTADIKHNDPTIYRCEDRAIRMGFKEMHIVNLFAFRSTLPENLLKAKDPFGPGNKRAILKSIKDSDLVLCAWGNHGSYKDASKEFKNWVSDLDVNFKIFKLNKNGEPAHPLYQPKSARLKKWSP